ncbi:MAG: hypothetical protein WC356_01490 [Candidatus Micrarchaeia archaeon]
MKPKKVFKAMAEVKRLILAYDALEARAKDDKYAYDGCKESGALRRASLDLSRALSDMRKA